MRFTTDLSLVSYLRGARRGIHADRIFDRGAVIDPDGLHGGRGVPENLNADTLFDAGALINPYGFHGGAGVAET